MARGKYSKSILSENKECYYCGASFWLEMHHIYFGKNRSASEKHGFKCWLCEAHHRGYCGVHGAGGHFLDEKLKKECQAAYERTHTREEFVKIIGKNYL